MGNIVEISCFISGCFTISHYKEHINETSVIMFLTVWRICFCPYGCLAAFKIHTMHRVELVGKPCEYRQRGIMYTTITSLKQILHLLVVK